MKEVHIIGCGGVGSYLILPLLRLLKTEFHEPKVVLWDADILEKKNINRQMFSADRIGETKSMVIMSENNSYYGNIEANPQWFSNGQVTQRGNFYFCCADNHIAHKETLQTVDETRGACIIAANEYTDAEAYYYEFSMKDRNCDPRLYYPEILTDHSDDPRSAQIGCTGEETVQKNPQLVVSNFLAASYALHLFYFWTKCAYEKMDLTEHFPIKHSSNFSKIRTTTRGEYDEQ